MRKIIILLTAIFATLFVSRAEEVTNYGPLYHTASICTTSCSKYDMDMLLGVSPIPLEVSDDLFANYIAGTDNLDDSLRYYSVKSAIQLGIDWNEDYYNSQDFIAKVIADITYWDVNNTSHTETCTLTVEYNKSSIANGIDVKSVDHYLFSGGLKFEADIVSLKYYDYASPTTELTSFTPANVYLTGFITAERYRTLATAQHFSISGSYTTGDDMHTISWSNINGAEEYEFEWTYVNSEADPQNYNFTNNSTRIITSGNEYKLRKIYEEGTIVYRVRAVGRDKDNTEKLTYGAWSLTASSGTLASLGGSTNLNITTGFEDNKNWQYSMSFAEEGKTKEVISYFDGTLRKRQTVARNNTDTKAIVANTIYDWQGRPAIETLPVPDMATGEYKLDYHELITLSATDVPYNFEDFDLDETDLCVSSTAPMLNSAGPGLYYSDQNPTFDDGDENGFIPDAQQYPFVQTEYTPDNTGRIRRKSGAGVDHILGSGHETQYRYGLPLQEQLDRLFANDVGYANHYTKEMVADPNGTISVTYKNASGKVIATALAGNPEETEALIALESSANEAQVINADLLNYSVQPSPDVLAVFRTHLVTTSNNHTFHYDVTRETFPTECLPEGVCFDCVYELELSIKDECFVELVPESLRVFTLGTADIDCDDSGELTFDLDDEKDPTGPLTLTLGVGAYTISKSLRLSRDASQYYLAQYIDTTINTCLTPFSDFLDNAVAALDFSGCGMDCQDCLDQLGPWSNYNEPNKANPDSAEFESGYIYLDSLQYVAAVTECNSLCLDGISPCDGYKQIMLADMSPGGQYAPFEYPEEPYSPDEAEITGIDTDDKYSIFYKYYNPSASDQKLDIVYSTILNELQTLLGTENILVEGVEVDIDNLTPEQFVEVWQDSWAEEILLDHHPEYCYYDFCLENEASYKFDRDFAGIMTFDAAETSGYLDPLNYNSTFPNGTGDPLFVPNSGSDSNFEDMQVLMDDYPHYNFGASDIDIWDVAAIIQMHDAGADYCESDSYWQIFKGLYQSLKQQALGNALAAACTTAAAYDFGTKARRFFTDFDQMYSAGGISEEVDDVNGYMSYPVTETDQDDVIDYMETLMQNQYSTQCQGYVVSWLEAVQPCRPVGMSDPAWLAAENWLKGHLIEICQLGSDPNNPFGASSSTTACPHGFYNFEDVMANFISMNNIDLTADCNPSVIGFPKPQGHNIFSGTSGGGVLDACACEQILDADSVFQSFGDTLPAGICNEAQYFESVFGQPVVDIDQLLKDCNISNAIDDFHPGDIVDCERIEEIYQDYLSDNSLSPSTDFTTIDIDVLTAYINNVLETEDGYDYEDLLSPAECYAIMKDCGTSSPAPSGINCDDFMEFAGAYEGGAFLLDPHAYITDFTTDANTYFSKSLTATDYILKLRACRNTYVTSTYTPDYKTLTGIERFIDDMAKDDILFSHAAEDITASTYLDFYKDYYEIDPGCDIWYKGEDFYQGALHDTAIASYTIQPNANDSITFTWSYPLNYFAGEKLTLRTSAWSDQALSNVTFDFRTLTGGSFSGTSSFTENLTANVTSSHNVTLLTNDPEDSLVFYIFARAFVNSAWDTINVRVAIPNTNYSADSKHYSEDLYLTFIDSCATTTVREQCIQLVKPDSIAWEDITGFIDINFEGTVTKSAATPSHIAQLRDDMEPYFTVKALLTGSDTVTLYGGSRCIPVATEKSADYVIPPAPVPSTIVCSECVECNDLLKYWVAFVQENTPYDLFVDETQPLFNPEYATAFTNYVNSQTNNNFKAPDVLAMAQNCFATATDTLAPYASNFINFLNDVLDETATAYNSTVSLEDAPFVSQLAGLGYTSSPSTCHPEMIVASASDIYIPELSIQTSFIAMNAVDECDMNSVFALLFDPAVNPNTVVSIIDIIDALYTGELDDDDNRMMRVRLELTGSDTISAFLISPAPLSQAYLDSNLLYQLCPQPLIPEVAANDSSDCVEYLLDIAQSNATMAYNSYISEVSNTFLSDYTTACMAADENFTMEYDDNEYHFTLYYYDQAGNLMKTVPPQGVQFVNLSTNQTAINAHRVNPGSNARVETAHTFNSNYVLNTLNQVTEENTPDAGTKQIWYDRLGRPVLSQTAEQKNDHAFTYTMYDELGRPDQVGKITFTVDDPVPTIENMWTEEAFESWVIGYYPDFLASEQVFTAYDEPAIAIPGFVQENLRGRVASVAISESGVQPGADMRYDHATHYSYDIHGNVKTLIQEFPNGDLFGDNLRYFRIDYDYDLVSGNVKQVWYQRGKADQFTHKYTYDADNRLAQVYTSTDGIIWHNDAEYAYYKHGPLARTELGDIKVQGTDYAYTIQGWMKGVNAGSLNSTRDMGQDGEVAVLSAKDAMGFTLGYYNGDYTGIGGTSFEPAQTSGDDFYDAILTNSGSSPGLFNGNITQMVTALMDTDRDPMPVAGNAYQYDQLNRIKHKEVFLNPDMHLTTGSGNTWSGISEATGYEEVFTYDANGNIYNLNRKGTTSTPNMDDMEYYYVGYNGATREEYRIVGGVPEDESGPVTLTRYTNQLAYVNDNTGYTSNYPDDIDDQSTGNYTYDLDGNLITDAAGGIDDIEWNNFGKIENIEFTGSKELSFNYDAQGNRVTKVVTPASGPPHINTYVRDAQGNVMAVYKVEIVGATVETTLEEQMLYGSSRIGVLKRDLFIDDAPIPETLSRASDPEESEIVFNLYDPEYPPTETEIEDPYLTIDHNEYIPKIYGDKRYELSNHLGNVLSVITDRKVPIEGTTDHIDFYEPWVLSANDYYAFGSLMPGRTEESDEYRYGFNGQEKDDEISGEGNSVSYKYRVEDTRLGRFLSVDPLTKKFPWYTPYQYAGNKPIAKIDIEGLEDVSYLILFDSKTGEGEIKLVTDYTTQSNIFLYYLKNMTDQDHGPDGGGFDQYIFIEKGTGAINTLYKTFDINTNKTIITDNLEEAQAIGQQYETQMIALKVAILHAAVEISSIDGNVSVPEYTETEEEGIVYRMWGKADKFGKEGKPYYGKADNENNYLIRQNTHIRQNPNSSLRFEIVGRAKPGPELLKLEQKFITNGGGPTNKGNPLGGTSNRRNNYQSETIKNKQKTTN